MGALPDRSRPPDLVDLLTALGSASDHWSALLKHVVARYGPVREQWRFVGAPTGWSARLLRGPRVLAYLTPQLGAFTVGVVLGGRAITAARSMRLPRGTRAVLAAAPRHAEGLGVRVCVRTAAQRALVAALIGLKAAR